MGTEVQNDRCEQAARENISPMNRRILIIVTCALVLSVCVSYLVYRAVGARPGVARQPQTTPVVVAARDLEVGSLIRNIDLKMTPWPGTLPKGAITKPDAIRNRGVASAIYEGEPITEARLAQPGSGGGLAGTIPAGMRACAVKVNEVVGVAGFVVPGMRVDVLVTGQPPGGNPLDGPRVRTLLQNIQVLSAGTNFQRDEESKPEQAQVVTLLVTPSQAEVLSLAGNETRIQLVLRNPMDTQVMSPPGAMVSNLFGDMRVAEAAPEATTRRITPATAHSVASGATAPGVTPPSVPLAASPPSAATPYVVEELNGATRTQVRFSQVEERPR